MTTSGAGVAIIHSVAAAAGTRPSARALPCHIASHNAPNTNRIIAAIGMAGASFTAPGWFATRCAIHNSSSSDLPSSHHTGPAKPIGSSNKLKATSGIDTKVTRGMANRLATAP